MVRERKISEDNFLYRGFKQWGGILIALVIICIVMGFMEPTFISGKNFWNVLRQATTNILLGYALAIVLICGAIDLSVASTLACASCMEVVLLHAGVPFGAALLLVLLTGILFGFINGFLVSRTKIPAFIVTLATMSIYRGCAYTVTGGVSVKAPSNKWFSGFGAGYIGPVPIPVIVVAIISIIIAFLLYKTRFSRHLFASGGNENAAVYSGVNVKNIRLIAYILSGFLAALAGAMYAARLNSGQPAVGSGWEGDAIAAAVLGGVSFSGGRGTVFGVVIGALVMTIITNGLNLMEISSYTQLLIKGVIILLAVYVDELKRKRSQS